MSKKLIESRQTKAYSYMLLELLALCKRNDFFVKDIALVTGMRWETVSALLSGIANGKLVCSSRSLVMFICSCAACWPKEYKAIIRNYLKQI